MVLVSGRMLLCTGGCRPTGGMTAVTSSLLRAVVGCACGRNAVARTVSLRLPGCVDVCDDLFCTTALSVVSLAADRLADISWLDESCPSLETLVELLHASAKLTRRATSSKLHIHVWLLRKMRHLFITRTLGVAGVDCTAILSKLPSCLIAYLRLAVSTPPLAPLL